MSGGNDVTKAKKQPLYGPGFTHRKILMNFTVRVASDRVSDNTICPVQGLLFCLSSVNTSGKSPPPPRRNPLRQKVDSARGKSKTRAKQNKNNICLLLIPS